MRKANPNKPFILIVLLFLVSLSSCSINNDLMLKTSKKYPYDSLEVLNQSAPKQEYFIALNDVIQLKFYTNNGAKVLDIASGTSVGANGGTNSNLLNSNTLQYTIMNDSLVKLPIVGEVNLVGKTIREAEVFLEDLYSDKYVDPFIQLSITNRRVIVFPGDGGEAQVVYLNNYNTTLMEAIALAGGLSDRGKAKKIKLIREVNGEKCVFLIDLSTIDGLKYTDVIVQNGDYIYVEPVPEVGKEVLQDVAPIISIVSGAAVVISLITLF